MKITGSHTVEVPRERLWAALQDPAVLARTLPGCESLTALGDDAYAATVTAGVASIKGTYSGQVQLHDKQEPGSYRLTAEGAGGPGTIRADAQVRLEEAGGSTVVHYDADAIVGGMIGGVGQRMIAGAARRTAGEFFAAVADDVLHGPQLAAAAPGGPAAAALAGDELADVGTSPSGDLSGGVSSGAAGTGLQGGATAGAAGGEVGRVFPGRAAAGGSGSARGDRKDLLLAFGLGALVALVGVLIGRRTARATEPADGRRRDRRGLPGRSDGGGRNRGTDPGDRHDRRGRSRRRDRHDRRGRGARRDRRGRGERPGDGHQLGGPRDQRGDGQLDQLLDQLRDRLPEMLIGAGSSDSKATGPDDTGPGRSGSTHADDTGPGTATWHYLLTIGAWKLRLARRLWSWAVARAASSSESGRTAREADPSADGADRRGARNDAEHETSAS